MTRKVAKKMTAVPKSPMSASEEPVERRCAGVDVEHLDELRGLEADSGYLQPVPRAEDGLAEDDVHGQQAQGRRRGQKARGLDPLQAPQPGAQEEVERDAQDDEDGLFEHVLRRRRGADRRAQRRQEKGQGLRLEARAAHAARHEIAEPLRHHEREEGQADGEEVLLLRRDGELQRQEGLEEREYEQRDARADEAPGGSAPTLQRRALGRVYLAEGQDGVAELDGVPVLDGLQDVYLVAVYIGALAGAEVRERPVAVPVPLEGGVQLRDAGHVEHYVGGGRAAYDALPVADGQGRAVLVEQPGPGLGLVALAEHGAYAAQKYPQRQNGQQILRAGHDV